MNKRTKWTLIIGGALAAVLTLSTTAFARPWGERGPGGPGGMMMRLLGRLDLNEQQELKVIRLRKNVTEQGREIRRELRGQALGLVGELEKPQADATKFHALVDEAAKKLTRLAHSAVDQVLEIHATLTPEQRQTLAEHARDMQERMQRFEDDDRPARKDRR